MTLSLWFLLLLALAIGCFPPAAALVAEWRGPGSQRAERSVGAALLFYAAGLLLFAGWHVAGTFTSLGDTRLRPGSGQQSVDGGAGSSSVQSLSCVRARQRMQRLQEASRGTIVYRGGNELRIQHELWAQVPVEGRSGLAVMIATVSACANSGFAAQREVVVRDLRSGRELARGIPASFDEP